MIKHYFNIKKTIEYTYQLINIIFNSINTAYKFIFI